MHRRYYRSPFRIIPLAFMALMFLALIFIGGRSRSQSAWMEGYMMGRYTAGEDGGDAIPFYGSRGVMGSAFSHIGGLIPMLLCGGFLLIFGLMFLPLMLFGMFFRRKSWKHFPGPEAKEWAKHWKKHRRYGPPWCWSDEDDKDDEEPEVEEKPQEPR